MLDQHLYSLESGTGTTTTPCYRSSTLKIPAILAKVQVGGYNKYARTLRMWLCMKWHGLWLYGVHKACTETAAAPCGTSHASAVSTSLRWILKKKKKCYKKLVTRVELHARAVSVLESGEQRCKKSDQQTRILTQSSELCESRGGRPGLPSLINLRFLWT